MWIVRSTVYGGDAEYSIHHSKEDAVGSIKKYLSEKALPDGMMNIEAAEYLSKTDMNHLIDKWYKQDDKPCIHIGCYCFEVAPVLSDGEGTACAHEKDRSKRVIWTSSIDIKDWEDDIKDEYGYGLSESKLYWIAYEQTRHYYDDERHNLSSSPNQPDEIFVLKVIQKRGVRSCECAIYKGGLEKILTIPQDDILDGEYYVENGEVKSKLVFKNSVHSCIYRGVKKDARIEDLEDMVRSEGEFPEQELINRYTYPLAPDVCDIYGWEVTKAA